MKTLLAIVSLAVLGGCAVAPAPGYYAVRQPVVDPHEWHTVSSEPIQGQATYAAPQQYAAAPVYSAPVYVQDPVYVASPVYVQSPYYYPPVSIGLDFGFGCCRGGWGRGGWGRGGWHR